MLVVLKSGKDDENKVIPNSFLVMFMWIVSLFNSVFRQEKTLMFSAQVNQVNDISLLFRITSLNHKFN